MSNNNESPTVRATGGGTNERVDIERSGEVVAQGNGSSNKDIRIGGERNERGVGMSNATKGALIAATAAVLAAIINGVFGLLKDPPPPSSPTSADRAAPSAPMTETGP